MPLLDARGLAVSTSDRESLDQFEAALASLQGARGDALARIALALARDPHFVAGHCLRAAALVIAGEAPCARELASAVGELERLWAHANERERRHGSAIRAWFDGDVARAQDLYGALVVDYPLDSLALQVAHALDFRFGQREMLRDRVAQVLPHWHQNMPGFSHILAMYAFGLEETGDYLRAEVIARRALELEPRNAAAIHVLTHVMEMQGHARQGIEWLEATRDAWTASAGFAIHIAWHLALFYLDLDAAGRALSIYDEAIEPRSTASVAALVDATALLWRLELRGVSAGARWRPLADCWSREPLRGQRAFNLVHAVIALSAARETAMAQRIVELLRGDPATRTANTPQDLELAVRLTEALLAFGRGHYSQAVAELSAVRAIANRCGGSVAQCDLIHLTLVEAALRSQRAQLARALTAERTARKPDSPLNQWLFARALTAPSAN
jgi:tetratricopeptide (TPR) repeat protein